MFDPIGNWPTNDPDETVEVVIRLTLNEYVQLASCVDVGRDIAYPEETEYIWWLWNRALMTVTLCDLINQCVAAGNVPEIAYGPVRSGSTVTWLPSDASVSDAINDVNAPIAPLDPTCNLDELWSGIREMVQRVDEEGRDILQDLAALNDRAERVQAFIDLVPILGDTIADTAEFLTETIPDLLNAYDSHSSPSQLDSVACDLFELCCSECRYPTFDEVLTYFFQRSILSPLVATTAQRLDIWNLFRTLGLVPASVWYSVNALQLWVLSVGSRWANVWGRRSLRIWASIGEDVPTDNWLTLCGGCAGEDLYNWENVVNNSFNPSTRGQITGGAWSDTDSARTSIPSESFRGIEIFRDVTSAFVRVEFTYGFESGAFLDGTVSSVFIHERNGTEIARQTLGTPPADGANVDVTVNVNAQVGDTFIIRLTCDHGPTGGLSGSCAIRTIQVIT
jgi:hypothetical protein